MQNDLPVPPPPPSVIPVKALPKRREAKRKVNPELAKANAAREAAKINLKRLQGLVTEGDKTLARDPQNFNKNLTAQQRAVLIDNSTDEAFTGKYTDHFKPGSYCCAQCFLELYKADAKFKTECGWPGFSRAKPGTVIIKQSLFGFDDRFEVNCAGCHGHLGHVFNEDTKISTTGFRHCINSSSIVFKSPLQMMCIATAGKVQTKYVKDSAQEMGQDLNEASVDYTNQFILKMANQ